MAIADVRMTAGADSGEPGPAIDARDGVPHAVLFDADGSDREVDVDTIDLASLSERQLLWIDQQGSPPEAMLRQLGLEAALSALRDNGGRPSLQNFGDWFLLRVVAVARSQPLQFAGDRKSVV